MSPAVRAGLAAGLLALTLSPAGSADKPTKVEIGKRGKAATAFVDVPGRGTGTAFCVHPSGLFVTNEHVVRGAEKGDLTLVLNPALPGEKVLKARVARADKDLDLALLRVETTADLPSLPLGSVEGVAELMDVVAFGFPLGRALAPDRKEHPAISVNAGTVTALRHKGGELQFLQIDVALTFGNSGGPVLDDNGRVVGVVVSGFGGGKGINQAIPVSRLDRFLQAPDVQFTPPALTPATLNTPLEFKARAVSVMPGAAEPILKLVLKAGDEAAREFPMTKRGGEWVATAAPSAKVAGSRVEVSARFGTGMVSGLTDDALLKVGDKPVRLSGVRRIETEPKPVVVLADGRTTLDGPAGGLGVVDLALGDQTVKIDLSKAARITVEPAATVGSVTATVVATVGGKEVGRVETPISVRDPKGIATGDPSSVVIRPPALAEDKVVKRLPDTFADVVPGGGGRYLVFHLPKLRKLAVFDINEARVTGYIPAADDKVTYAAGLDAVIVGLPGTGMLERWSLTTFEKEKAAPPPFKDEIKMVLMGHAATGMVVANGYFLDPVTFRQLPIVGDKNREQVWAAGDRRYPSADGTVFGYWRTGGSPAYSYTQVVEGGVVRGHETVDLMHVIPGPDGREVFTGRGIASRTLQRGSPDDATYGYCLPAVRGDYFVSLTPANNPKSGGFAVYLRGLKQPIGKLDGADHGLEFNGWDREDFGPWRRVFFVPDAKVIATLPPSNDQVVLHRFDPDAALEKSGQDYLVVTSRPAPAAKPGETFTYTLAVKAKTPAVTVKLETGPKGMTVTPAGAVSWSVPADTPDGDADVILSVRDGGGQEVFHTFRVRVVR